MIRQALRPALTLLAAFTVLLGLVYPALVTAVLQGAFPQQSQGSLIYDATGRLMGSSLIGQSFSAPGYFWSRPSATMMVPYNAAASGASNWGMNAPALLADVAQRVTALRHVDPGNDSPVPVDLVTASASGLDPHITVAAAQYQLPRVARVRGMPVEQLRILLAAHTTPRQFGLLGEARVNVLELNMALDRNHQ
ncbi:MAG: potassium-transporting ATPase subunit KdpC [Alphaproteobacteria bacterium]|nr:MAG: potassium-transporting ATPase subunit KdpC [Alphaproteobacteria bacterium]